MSKLFHIFLLVVGLAQSSCQMPAQPEKKMFHLDDSLMRHARLRCMQQFPQAETVNFTESYETQCFLHCFLYRTGLMDLGTRGLDSNKFIDIWENIEEAFEEDDCLERFDFSESLNGSCKDTYRKLMQFRSKCWELFEYTFASKSIWRTDHPKESEKSVQYATEFCDLLESEDVLAIENSQEADVSLRSRYKEKLECIFRNMHYLDAYGRVDETEILLSFQEAHEDSIDLAAAVRICAHRANSKYQNGYLGNTAFALQKCLKRLGPVYAKVFKQRDATSRQY